MATVLTLGSLKGGVGKTVASTNVAACLAMRGYKTLFIDLDPQATATAHFGIDPVPDEGKRIPTVGEILYTPENYAQVELREAIVKHDRIENLWVIPSYYAPLDAAEGNLDGFARRHRGTDENQSTSFLRFFLILILSLSTRARRWGC